MVKLFYFCFLHQISKRKLLHLVNTVCINIVFIDYCRSSNHFGEACLEWMYIAYRNSSVGSSFRCPLWCSLVQAFNALMIMKTYEIWELWIQPFFVVCFVTIISFNHFCSVLQTNGRLVESRHEKKKKKSFLIPEHPLHIMNLLTILQSSQVYLNYNFSPLLPIVNLKTNNQLQHLKTKLI